MRFLLMILDDASAWANVSAAEMDSVMQQHDRLRAALEAKGRWIGCDRLRPAPEAATVRERDGRHVVSDGPFAETKEVMGGYYLISADSKAEAVEWAKQLPLRGRSTVEIRQIWDA
jgi:hypothetical protein